MADQRDRIAGLPAYRQGATPSADGVIKLSSNENPYPPLPSVMESVRVRLGSFHRYPDMGAVRLRERLAARHGVSVEDIAPGAGSVEVASQLVHALADCGDEVVFAWRSFEAYPLLVQTAGAVPVPVPLTAESRHDLDAMADAITERTRLILLCTPNNPTGTAITSAELELFLARVPERVVVVIDEAYTHFNRMAGAASGMDFFRDRANVVVLHTFSKAYGLAGLRLGYAIARAPIAARLRAVAVPFAVTDLAQAAGIASLEAEAELVERVDLVVAERERVTRELRGAGWALPDSHANFVWLDAGAGTSALERRLRAGGVLVRAWDGEGLRITIGSVEENDRVLAALTGQNAGAAVVGAMGAG